MIYIAFVQSVVILGLLFLLRRKDDFIDRLLAILEADSKESP